MNYYMVILVLLNGISAYSQQLSSEEIRKYTLKNSIDVELMTQADCSQCYYYLPTNLGVSMNGSNPEISLIKWEKEGETEAGGILHFLVQWQLSKVQLSQIEDLIKSDNKEETVIMGPVSVEAYPTDNFFYGDHELVEILNIKLQHKPPIATTPGAKMAFSFRLTKKDIDVLDNYLLNIHSHNSELRLYYNYKVGSENQKLGLSIPLKNILVYLK